MNDQMLHLDLVRQRKTVFNVSRRDLGQHGTFAPILLPQVKGEYHEHDRRHTHHDEKDQRCDREIEPRPESKCHQAPVSWLAAAIA